MRMVWGRAAIAALVMIGTSTSSIAWAASGAEETSAASVQKLKALEASLHPQDGVIHLPVGKAVLNLGKAYYFLPAADAKRVLTEAWGNPPSASEHVLGLVFPTGRSFHDGSWGAVVNYEESGHIDDKDAGGQDYDAVLKQMKEADEGANKASVNEGFAASHTVGWAQPPSYDQPNRTLIWARDIKFDGGDTDTLNYDVRRLGRTGVLSLNMVDSMPNLPVVRAAAAGLGKAASFDSGGGYGDFDSKTDKLADYGLAGLVAAGAGLLIAKKVGFIGIALLFLKKFIILFLAAFAGGWRWLKQKLGRGGAAADGE